MLDFEQEILRKDWLFNLVGAEHFTIGKVRFCVSIDPLDGFTYEYSLKVNGKAFEKFSKIQSKIMKTWIWKHESTLVRIVLGMFVYFINFEVGH